jgi:hypothetical protein
MAYLPSLGTYDLAVFGASALIIVVAYLLFPPGPGRIIAWLVVFVIHLGWMAFFLQKWVFETEA